MGVGQRSGAQEFPSCKKQNERREPGESGVDERFGEEKALRYGAETSVAKSRGKGEKRNEPVRVTTVRGGKKTVDAPE